MNDITQITGGEVSLATVKSILDTTRKDMAVLEGMVYIGQAGSPGLTQKFTDLNARMHALSQKVNELEQELDKATDLNNEDHIDKEIRIKRLERFMAMTTGVILFIGAAVTYLIQYFKT